MNTAMPTTSMAMMTIMMIIELIIVVFYLACNWIIFQKAGKPGWAIIIPIYNIIVFLQIVKRPVWWIILLIIPVVNIIILIILYLDLAKSFGKSGAWGFFMLFILGIIGIPMLAFGKSTYTAITRS